LKTLDITKNTALKEFRCQQNKLDNLDLSHNLQLMRVSCEENKIKTLDLSKNTALLDLICSSNELTSLNLKNGNNSTISYVSALKNDNLKCIQVDNVDFPSSRWFKDSGVDFSTSCQ
jgi:hypothetical protein